MQGRKHTVEQIISKLPSAAATYRQPTQRHRGEREGKWEGKCAFRNRVSSLWRKA
jgi:hypothetical protein